MTPQPSDRAQQGLGVAYSVGAYLIWGFLPLYFLLLVPTGPWEVVAARVVFSFVFCLLLLTVARGWRRIMAIIRQPKLLAWTALAGVLIYVNWQVFLIGTLSGHVVETALGYFINPITTVLLGVFVLRERIRRLQWVAIGVAVVAVVVIIVAYGSFPWIALSLTASFGTYGLIKKKIGPAVDAVSGLTLESFWLLPIAVVQLIIVAQTTGITFGTVSTWHTVLMLFAGVATAVPLLLFASGARRINLTVIGMIQFITPIMQFLTGVLLLHEPMPTERWIGFILVWIAVGVFVVDLLRAGRRGRRARVAPVP
ncbi:EamA family transporter RarD [Microbacterium murale]|uniref:Protein RarD n=1 Tax=Microbacterium murale TaxID=1081040 RepID=A0ABQ1RMG9_9MICO|nr:EamA family transporter RarD [Microbacterium murale]GGD74843.1 protein RarD [Microbacterium murale]